MTIPQEFFKTELSDLELSVIRVLYRKTKDQQTFSSDDLRKHELDKYLDGPNGIGGVFGFMVRVWWIKEVGRAPSTFPSTHSRKVGLYVWTEKGRKALEAREVRV